MLAVIGKGFGEPDPLLYHTIPISKLQLAFIHHIPIRFSYKKVL